MFGHHKDSPRSTYQSRRGHSTTHLHSRALRFETLEDRRMLAQLVGIDFDLNSSQVPLNWNRVPSLGISLYSNLIDEAGVGVPFDLVVNGTAAPADQGVILGNNDPAPGTIPNHTNPLANLHGFAFAENSPTATINATWSDLDPIRMYEIFVIGFDGDGLSNVQNVSIVGSGTTGFSQSPNSNELWINGEKGDSGRSFDSYAVLAQPDAAGVIAIATQVASGGAVLGGLAIRQSDTIVVNSNADNTTPGDGFVTLREAIIGANGNAGADTITFDPAVFSTQKTIALGSELPTITDEVTITGPGQSLLTLDAGDGADNTFATGDGFRIFDIDDGNASLVDVQISDLTLTGGDLPAFPLEGSILDGGAVLNSESLTITDATITGNSAASGGAIYSFETLNVFSSTISDNRARNGGGAGIASIDSLDIVGSTISGNIAINNNGGGIVAMGVANISRSTISGNIANNTSGGGIQINNGGNLTVIGSTITDNRANGRGGGIDAVFGSLTMNRSILTGNFDFVGTDDLGGTASGSFNLIGGDSGLGPLADNGGHTKTHALLPGSPAIDAVGVLDNFSSDNFASNYNFVDLFSSADNNPQVSGGQANLNVGTGTGAFIWNQGEKLSSTGEEVSIDFGFNYPIATAGFAQSSAGLALFDSVTGNNLLAEVRVETDKTDGSSVLSLKAGGTTTPLSGQPVGLMNLTVFVFGTSSFPFMDVQYTLSGDGFSDITGTLGFNVAEIFFGPVAFDVSGTESVHDNLVFDKLFVSVDQRGLPRPVNGGHGLRHDIGAYEAQAAPSADFVDNDFIDGADFLAWQRGFGTTTGAVRTDGNSDDDTDVDASDLAAWATTFGQIEATPLIAASSASSDQAPIAAPVTSATSLSPTLTTNELLDASQAWELAHEVDAEQEPVLDPQPSATTASHNSYFHANETPATPLAPDEPDLSSTNSRNASVAEPPWLTEELLERIFG